MIKRIKAGSRDSKDTHKSDYYKNIFSIYNKKLKTLPGMIVDPFARNCEWADLTNDLNPNTKAKYNLDAFEFLKTIPDNSTKLILFDPPFSQRQEIEKYGSNNLYASDSNKISLITKEFQRILLAGGIVIKLGYNSTKIKNLDLIDCLIVNFGGSRNDVIITIHKKMNKSLGDYCE